MAKHARIGPSGLHRTLNCPGSLRMADQVAKPAPNIYASTGSVAHKAGEMVLKGKSKLSDLLGTSFSMEGFTIPIDKEMTDAVQVYLDWIEQFRKRPHTDDAEYKIMIEKTINLDQLWDGNPPERIFGTADAIIEWGETLVVGDYKHGAGVIVNVRDNPQLLAYALGALYEVGTDRFKDVQITVIQPRRSSGNAISSDTLSVVDLLMWGDMVLKPGVEAMLGPSPQLVVGDWCRFCPARVSCPAIKKVALDTAKVEFGDIPPVVMDLSDTELGSILNKAEIIRSWLDSCRTEASARLDRGTFVPGWKLVDKRAQRKWSDDGLVCKKLADLDQDAADFMEVKLKSPTQIENMDGGLYAKLENLVEKKSSGTTLAPNVDVRTAIAAGPTEDFAPAIEDIF